MCFGLAQRSRRLAHSRYQKRDCENSFLRLTAPSNCIGSMIKQLCYAVPLLPRIGGWSTCTTPPLVRHFLLPLGASAVLAPSPLELDSQADIGVVAIDTGIEKKNHRTSRGTGAADGEKPALADSASEGYSPAIKHRTMSRRKAVVPTGSSEAAEHTSTASSAVDSYATPTLPPKRTRRKKQEDDVRPSPAAETGVGIASLADADADARRSSGSAASSSSAAVATNTPSTIPKQRTMSKKASIAVDAVPAQTGSNEKAARDEERIGIQGLPYEDFLVQPRKTEQILVALGLRPPLETFSAAGAVPTGSTDSPSFASSPSSIGNILELATFLNRPDPKELVAPLLIAQYQGYLGPSPDYLYDLFYLDFDLPYLPSEVVRKATISVARSVVRASGVLSAKGSSPEALTRAAMDQLQADVGEAALAAQEGRAPRLTEAQLELFLLDFASARLAGLRGEGGLAYIARRCAALQLTRPIVVERLYRYTVLGEGLEQLAARSRVRMSQPMDALMEGLKAGVRLDPERLLRDFRLTSPGSPMTDHLEVMRRAVMLEAGRSLEPGSSLFYTTLVDRLQANPDLRWAIQQQERQWETEQGERDGSALTLMQLRLLFYLWRRERFHAEELARRNEQSAAAGGAS